jgi:hypothetical protein
MSGSLESYSAWERYPLWIVPALDRLQLGNVTLYLVFAVELVGWIWSCCLFLIGVGLVLIL